jgi:hypothetical protein
MKGMAFISPATPAPIDVTKNHIAMVVVFMEVGVWVYINS